MASEQHDRIAHLLRAMDAECGPVPADLLNDARQLSVKCAAGRVHEKRGPGGPCEARDLDELRSRLGAIRMIELSRPSSVGPLEFLGLAEEVRLLQNRAQAPPKPVEEAGPRRIENRRTYRAVDTREEGL